MLTSNDSPEAIHMTKGAPKGPTCFEKLNAWSKKNLRINITCIQPELIPPYPKKALKPQEPHVMFHFLNSKRWSDKCFRSKVGEWEWLKK
jgi:hypothetical protein